jgi:glutathione S-transferase
VSAVPGPLRVYRIPYSTNVERVALALGHKGVGVEWIDVDPRDRAPVRAVSGQDLVPVLVDGDQVVTDSMRIVRHLEQRHPDPPLYPTDPARRAATLLFVDWFDRVWKGPPNEMEAELGREAPNAARLDALSARMRGSLELFDGLLTDRDVLLGRFGAADWAAYPFLKYGMGRPEGDEELFHRILSDHLTLSLQDSALMGPASLSGPVRRRQGWTRSPCPASASPADSGLAVAAAALLALAGVLLFAGADAGAALAVAGAGVSLALVLLTFHPWLLGAV